jgi:HEPN domain-containing protein
MGKEEFLKRRAMEFYKLARRNFEDGFYNISAFEIEQACQLYLKYILATSKYGKCLSLVKVSW